MVFFDFSNKVLKYPLSHPQDAYFGDVDTVIHAGAHLAEERIYYLKSNLKVYWIEANPKIHKKMMKNIRFYRNQKGILATLSQFPGEKVEFYIANDTSCSSVLEFNDLEVTPTHHHVEKIMTVTTSLSELISKKRIILGEKNLLLVDTQGTELQVIKGLEEYLCNFEYIIAESQDYELYQNQSLTNEIEAFLLSSGFSLVKKESWDYNMSRSKNCYELIFKKITVNTEHTEMHD